MSVINYLSSSNYVLIILNQPLSKVWGTQDSLLKGYRKVPLENPSGNKISGFNHFKDSALKDVYTFNTVEEGLKIMETYLQRLKDHYGYGFIKTGDYEGRAVSISAGPLDKWKDFENWVPDSINGLKERIIGPFPKIGQLLKDYIVEREKIGLATHGHITLFAEKPKDDKRSDIRLYEWILIPVRGTI